MRSPALEIVNESGVYRIKDDGGSYYGPDSKTKKEAEVVLKEWVEYYQGDLP